MKKFKTQSYLFRLIIVLLFISSKSLLAQTNIIDQDPQIEQLLIEKRNINSSITIVDRWKIQIFTGDNENSRKVLSDFKKDVKTIDCTIVFHTPSYKVWVGNFKTRIEAERNLIEIKKKYPNAFLIKPNK